MRIPAALLALATLAAAPEDWREISDGTDAPIWVDVASIHTEGTFRLFRMKGRAEDVPGDGIAQVAIDCRAKTWEERRVDIVKDGTILVSRVFDPPFKMTLDAGDASDKAILALVCTG